MAIRIFRKKMFLFVSNVLPYNKNITCMFKLIDMYSNNYILS